MSLRLAKQIIYGVFYLLVWAGLIWGTYSLFLRPAPSCFDNIQNQNEEGVDCGGPCSKVCIPKEIRPIALVGRVLTFPTDTKHLSVLAEINNPNASYAAKSFQYEFSFYDQAGKVLRTLQGNSFLYASEINKYILVPNVSFENSGFVSRVDFSITGTEWDSANNFKGPPLIIVQGVKASVGENGLTVEGRVTNNDTMRLPVSTVVAVFGGRYGEVAGVSETEVDDLGPNESKPFSILYPDLQNIDASSTRLFVYSRRP